MASVVGKLERPGVVETHGAGTIVGGVDLLAVVSLVLMVLIGSSTAPSARYAVRELPVALIPLIRFGVAGLFVLPLARRGGGLAGLFRQDLWRLLAAAALCVPVNQYFFLNGAKLAPTSHVAIIYAACPLVVLLLAVAAGQERLSGRRLAGVLASVGGLAVLGLGNLSTGGPGAAQTLRGDLLLICAVTSWGAYLTLNKPLVARHGAIAVLCGTFLTGAALDLPVALLTAANGPSPWSASSTAWIGLGYLTLVVTVLGLAFQNQALRRLDASQVATFGNAAPMLTVLWGVLLFHEAVTPALALGGALTLCGILITTRSRPAPARPAA